LATIAVVRVSSLSFRAAVAATALGVALSACGGDAEQEGPAKLTDQQVQERMREAAKVPASAEAGCVPYSGTSSAQTRWVPPAPKLSARHDGDTVEVRWAFESLNQKPVCRPFELKILARGGDTYGTSAIATIRVGSAAGTTRVEPSGGKVTQVSASASSLGGMRSDVVWSEIQGEGSPSTGPTTGNDDPPVRDQPGCVRKTIDGRVVWVPPSPKVTARRAGAAIEVTYTFKTLDQRPVCRPGRLTVLAYGKRAHVPIGSSNADIASTTGRVLVDPAPSGERPRSVRVDVTAVEGRPADGVTAAVR
jgi:hypothetical protein